MVAAANCITCGIFTQLDDLSIHYGREVFEALAPNVRVAFSSFVGLWFAFQLLYKGLFRGELAFKELMPQMLLFVAVDIALRGSGLYWDFFYNPVRDTMSGLAQAVVVPTGGEVQDKSIPGLLLVVEDQMRRVLEIGGAMIKDAGMTGIGLIVGGLILMVPYLFVWCVFMAFMLEGMFKLLAITALAPVAIALSAFGPTRGFSIAALRVVINGALTVVFAAVAMGFTVAVVRYYLNDPVIPLDADGRIVRGASDFVFSPAYYSIFILGFISILFHLKAATLASNISGASDGPGAAATVVGAGMAMLAYAKKTAMAPVNAAGQRAAAWAGGQVSDRARGLIDSFTKPSTSYTPADRSRNP